MKTFSLVFVFMLLEVPSVFGMGDLRDRFFATDAVQRQAPGAFVLQDESLNALKQAKVDTENSAQKLVDAVVKNSVLLRTFVTYEKLSTSEKVEFLKKLFVLETSVLGIVPPELIFDSEKIRGEAYFDFNPEHPTPGTVILNPSRFDDDINPYESLILLVHETRHSGQFQQAYAEDTALSKAFKTSFVAQKKLPGRLSYLDFMSLFNEFEAFRFANLVVGKLSQFVVSPVGMGSYASQFNRDGDDKINLIQLFTTSENHTGSIVERFNRLEEEQFKLLYP